MAFPGAMHGVDGDRLLVSDNELAASGRVTPIQGDDPDPLPRPATIERLYVMNLS